MVLRKKNWSFDKWATVIFSDESNFQLMNRKNTPLVHRFKNENMSLCSLNSVYKPVVAVLASGVKFQFEVLVLARFTVVEWTSISTLTP